MDKKRFDAQSRPNDGGANDDDMDEEDADNADGDGDGDGKDCDDNMSKGLDLDQVTILDEERLLGLVRSEIRKTFGSETFVASLAKALAPEIGLTRLTRLVKASTESTQKLIGDLATHVDDRLDDVDSTVDGVAKALTDTSSPLMKALSASSAADDEAAKKTPAPKDDLKKGVDGATKPEDVENPNIGGSGDGPAPAEKRRSTLLQKAMEYQQKNPGRYVTGFDEARTQLGATGTVADQTLDTIEKSLTEAGVTL